MLKCLIIDDDNIFTALLEHFVNEHPELEFVNSFTDSNTASKALASQNIDLVLLDIEMPGMTGMELIKLARNVPQVIFITAHPEYAVEAFEYDVTDYIVKPLTQSRFTKAINKALDIARYQEFTRKKNELSFKVDGKYVRIDEKNIAYIQSHGDYIKIYEEDNRYVILGTLNNMQNTLDPEWFMRIHRRYIVNIKLIESVKGYNILLQNGEQIPVSRSLKSELVTRLQS